MRQNLRTGEVAFRNFNKQHCEREGRRELKNVRVQTVARATFGGGHTDTCDYSDGARCCTSKVLSLVKLSVKFKMRLLSRYSSSSELSSAISSPKPRSLQLFSDRTSRLESDTYVAVESIRSNRGKI